MSTIFRGNWVFGPKVVSNFEQLREQFRTDIHFHQLITFRRSINLSELFALSEGAPGKSECRIFRNVRDHSVPILFEDLDTTPASFSSHPVPGLQAPVQMPLISRFGLSILRMVIMPIKKRAPVDWESLLTGIPQGKTAVEYGADRDIFMQGQIADSIFYLRRGKVKLSVLSQLGKVAIVASLSAGDFLGEGCLAGQQLRMSTATAVNDCGLFRIEKELMTRMLHERHEISELFAAHLLCRNIRFEADLVDQLFSSSEKRLARILLLLSHFGKESRAEVVLPRVSQDSLAQMVGTTRSRVSHFMNKFRKLGFINYGDDDSLTVHSGLLSIVLHD
jgi:CRP/FNR family transcriptional regulator, cyclic AMP receptor protein